MSIKRQIISAGDGVCIETDFGAVERRATNGFSRTRRPVDRARRDVAASSIRSVHGQQDDGHRAVADVVVVVNGRDRTSGVVVVVVGGGGGGGRRAPERHQFQLLRRLRRLRRLVLGGQGAGHVVELLERRERARTARGHRVDGRDGGHDGAAVMAVAAVLAAVAVAAGAASAIAAAATAAAAAYAEAAYAEAAAAVAPGVGAARLAAAVRRRARSLVLVGPAAAHAEPAEQHEQVAAVLLGEQRVQVRVGTRVERVEEHEHDLGLGHVDQRVTGQRGQPEERHRRPAREVREHQQRHALGHRHVGTGRRRHRLPAAPDRRVHLRVARAYHRERHPVEREQREQVQLVGERRAVHGQANAETTRPFGHCRGVFFFF